MSSIKEYTHIQNLSSIYLRGTMLILNILIALLKEDQERKHYLSTEPFIHNQYKKFTFLTIWGLYGCSFYFFYAIYKTFKAMRPSTVHLQVTIRQRDKAINETFKFISNINHVLIALQFIIT